MEKRCYGCMRLKTQSPICEHCGFNENVENLSHQLPMGMLLQNRYMIGKVLGQGGFGITYLGWDDYLDIPVAIKEYYPNGVVVRDSSQSPEVTCCEGNTGSLFQSNRDRFLREAKALAKFSDVPEIVHVQNLFLANNTAYIVMEYVKGTDLRRYIHMRGGKLTAEETFTILRPVMEALSKVHEAGLVHRDISPDNIMLLPKGGAKLLDFGAVRDVGHADVNKELPKSTETILKHGFAPIEQYRRRGSLGPWTDVYALCATIYYCLTGSVPFDAPERIMGDDNVDWSRIPGLSGGQISALERGMALMPDHRIGSVAELCELLFAQPAKPAEQKAPVVPEEKSIPIKPQEPEKKPYPSQTLPLEEDVVTDYMAPIAEQKPYPAYTLPLEEETAPVYTASIKRKEPTCTIPVEQPEPGVESKPEEKKPVWVIAVAAILAVAVLLGIFASTGAKKDVVSPDAWRNNVLMKNPYSKYGVERKDIISVTFLDTIANAPITAWDVSEAQNRSVLAWVKKSGEYYDLYIAGNGGINAGNACEQLFSNYTNLYNVTFNNCFHTEEVTSMRNMFYGCRSLKYLNGLDSFITSRVSNMSGLFNNCNNLTSLDLRNWNTSNVTNMEGMFAYCNNLSSLNVSTFNTSNVKDMSTMFTCCKDLSSLDINEWDTFNVTDMAHMFSYCENLNFLDLSSWNTANVNIMEYMFFYCTKLDHLKLGDWETDNCSWYDADDFIYPNATYDGRPWEELFTGRMTAAVPLIQFDILGDSNPSGSNKDVRIGNWKSSLGNEIPNSIKFWVVEREGYNSTEYIDFDLGGERTLLSGHITAGEECAPNALMTIRIIGDGEVIAEYRELSVTAYEEFTVELDKVETLRVECSTETDVFGHCIFEAFVT